MSWCFIPRVIACMIWLDGVDVSLLQMRRSTPGTVAARCWWVPPACVAGAISLFQGGTNCACLTEIR